MNSSILGAIEELLTSALHTVNEPGRVSRSGSDTPPPGEHPHITVAALEIDVNATARVDRRPVRRTTELALSPAGGARSFPLPKGTENPRVELTTAEGEQLCVGDDFTVEAGELRLLGSRHEGALLRARLLGAPVDGYCERATARVRAKICVWARARASLDAMSGKTTAALVVLASAPRRLHTRVELPTASVELTLCDASPRWTATRRRHLTAGDAATLCDELIVDVTSTIETRVYPRTGCAAETIREIVHSSTESPPQPPA